MSKDNIICTCNRTILNFKKRKKERKKKKILPFATTWMNLEDIMPSEVSQT